MYIEFEFLVLLMSEDEIIAWEYAVSNSAVLYCYEIINNFV